jgi:hypothetical protein
MANVFQFVKCFERAAIPVLVIGVVLLSARVALAVGTADGAVPVGTASTASQLGVMGGGVAIGSAYAPTTAAPADSLIVSGGAGVGTATPQSHLHINSGELQVGSSGASCVTANAGALRYANLKLQFCNGFSWVFTN